MSLDHDLAWAAGLFEGEGFTVRRAIGNRIYLEIGIEMRDLDVLQRFVVTMRAHNVTPETRPGGPRSQSAIRLRRRTHKNPNHSDMHTWKTVGITARSAYELMRPYLGERRRTKADSILKEADVINDQLAQPRPCRECGSPFEMKPHGRNKAFCSPLCRSRWRIKQPGAREAARQRNRRYEQRQRAARLASYLTTADP